MKLICINIIILLLFLSCNNSKQVNNTDEVASTQSNKRPNILFVILDDWSWPHASAYGNKMVKTPAFDRIAREGILFTNAFAVSPSCTPSRGSILTGQTIHRLEEGANLWSILPAKFPVYPEILEEAGYQVGFTGKGWGPGVLYGSGRTRNPAGPKYNNITLKAPAQWISDIDYAANFKSFFIEKPNDKPFCFWYGSIEPHRPYEKSLGLKQGKNPNDVQVPAFLPDIPEARNGILNYYSEIEWADKQLGKMIKFLEKAGELENTLIMVTGDNGMPFPRAKKNLYDAGTRMPLAVSWPARFSGGRIVRSFISFTDFAPTFMEAAGLEPLPEMTGRSFLDLLDGKTDTHRDKVFVEKERHTTAREGKVGYPSRGIRTRHFLYIRNIYPDRWPVGDPENENLYELKYPTGQVILNNRHEEPMKKYFDLAFGKRPAEELYDLSIDSAQLVNVADDPGYASQKRKLREELENWMQETADPRANNQKALFDTYPDYRNRRELKN